MRTRANRRFVFFSHEVCARITCTLVNKIGGLAFVAIATSGCEAMTCGIGIREGIDEFWFFTSVRFRIR
jgi:hypothetical protein